MLASLDEAVGQIVAAVDKRGWRTNTLILFSTDNGGPNPDVLTSNGEFRAGKSSIYEGGVRACAFAHWPGQIRSNTVVNAPLHIVDWYPTLLKLAGSNLKQGLPLDGRDCWAAITQNAPSPHEAILINAAPHAGALRMGEWKLVLNGQRRDTEENENSGPGPGPDRIELYNVAKDPGEKINLAASRLEKVRELRAHYDTFARAQVPPMIEPKPAGFRVPEVWGEVESSK
jgi:arylsulfatase A-like enzyme